MSGDLCLENYILHWNFKSHKGTYVLEALWLHPLFQVLSRHLFTDLIPVFLIIKEVECLFINTFSRTSLDPTFLTEFPGGVSLEQRLRWWWTLIISRLLIVTIFPSWKFGVYGLTKDFVAGSLTVLVVYKNNIKLVRDWNRNTENLGRWAASMIPVWSAALAH